MTEPRPIDPGTEPEQPTDQDPIGAIAPPKTGRHGARALALAGFATAAGLVAGHTNDTPTWSVTIG